LIISTMLNIIARKLATPKLALMTKNNIQEQIIQIAVDALDDIFVDVLIAGMALVKIKINDNTPESGMNFFRKAAIGTNWPICAVRKATKNNTIDTSGTTHHQFQFPARDIITVRSDVKLTAVDIKPLPFFARETRDPIKTINDITPVIKFILL